MLVGAFAASCSLTSLDRYFVCDPDHQQCRASTAGSGGEAGFGASDAGGGLDGVAGQVGGAGPSGGGSPIAGAGAGADAGGAAAGAGGSGGTGAGRGESCMTSQDCAMMLTCFKGICGDALELTYLDTPDIGSVPTAAKWIKFEVFITNRTQQNSYALSQLKVRYYYTADGITSEFQALTTQPPPTAIADVTGVFGMSQGWTYLEVGFDSNAGSLGAGKTTGIVKVGVHPQNFTAVTFYEPGDYSYVPDVGMSHMAGANRRITLYVDSVLVSGVEPPSPPPT